MTNTIEVFPFHYPDARTSKRVKAHYKAERDEIAARYAEWEIAGPGEERRPIDGDFNPIRRSSRRFSWRRGSIAAAVDGRGRGVIVTAT